MIECPYSQFDLRLAALKMSNSDVDLGDEKKMKEIKDKYLELFPKEKSKKNEKTAEYQGIEVLDLINSPNYETLLEEYTKHAVKELVSFLQKSLNLSHKQAWLMIAVMNGAIDLS